MEERNDVQALERISNEVDESQIKVILSSQCNKAQALLLNKLEKQAERYRETCSFINSANLKVESEIKQAQQEIRSMLTAQETLKSANLEIRKDWLLAKHQRTDITKRVTEGKTKYESMWFECKTKYETIPFVQKLLQAEENQKTYEHKINNLDKEITKLYEDTDEHRQMYATLTKTRAIELANFMINERSKIITTIKEKTDTINKLTQDIEFLLKDEGNNTDIVVEITKPSEQNEVINMNKSDENSRFNWEDDSLIPKLNLSNFDLDSLDVNFDQVKIKKDEMFRAVSSATNSIVKNMEHNFHEEKTYDFMKCTYFKPLRDEKPRNFSERKLIKILEDININNCEAYNIVRKINPEQLPVVGDISANILSLTVPNNKDEKTYKAIVDEIMVEIDLTSSTTFENIIIPPMQFSDITDEKTYKAIVDEKMVKIDLTSSTTFENVIIPPMQFSDITDLQDDTPKKRVCFELPSSVQIHEICDEKEDNEEVNETINQSDTQLNESAMSDESFKTIKQMLLKKHNLELSPQFVYAKNNTLIKKDDEVIKSNFFDSRKGNVNDVVDVVGMEVDEQKERQILAIQTRELQKDEQQQQLPESFENIVVPMDVDKPGTLTSSLQTNKVVNLKSSEEKTIEKPVSGLLKFTHGTREIPDSLNVSLSTNGYEDSDFPLCIDSSLLSPKAELTGNIENQKVGSQEEPNFLSGLRKTGFSLFGGPVTSFEPKPEANNQSEGNNFSFNFGG